MRAPFAALLAFIAGCPLFPAAPASAAASGPTALLETARTLVAAYPEAAMTLEERDDGLYILTGGQSLLFSPASGCPEIAPEEPPENSGERPDPPLCALFSQAYPTGRDGRFPAPGFEPGRIRHETLLRLLYGRDSASVAGNCVTVSFLGKRLLFNSRHGAARALSRVAARLERPARDPKVRHWLLPAAGTFCWRPIASSPRLSPHSFGIAVDLNEDKGLYWRWNPSRSAVARVRREYPQAVVDAFEAEGFIWGGKWHAFDFMHFEYRPELRAPDQE
jgi:hypothetical protein